MSHPYQASLFSSTHLIHGSRVSLTALTTWVSQNPTAARTLAQATPFPQQTLTCLLPPVLSHPCCPLLSSVLLLTSTRYSSVTPHHPPTGANTLPQLTMEHFLSLKFRDQLCSTGEWGKSPAPPRKSWESRSLRVSDPCVSKCFVSLVPWLCASPGFGKATLSTQEILRRCPERAPLSQVGKPLSLGWEPASLLAVANQESAWGFSSLGCQLLQARGQQEADGQNTGLTNQTFSAKAFQKQGSGQRPNPWGCHSLLYETLG